MVTETPDRRGTTTRHRVPSLEGQVKRRGIRGRGNLELFGVQRLNEPVCDPIRE